MCSNYLKSNGFLPARPAGRPDTPAAPSPTDPKRRSGPLNHGAELPKQHVGIMGSRRGFRVILHAKKWLVLVTQTFHGPVVGAMPGLPYEQDRDRLHHGDTILIFTDGVTEAFDEEEQLFSEQRLEAVLLGDDVNNAENIIFNSLAEVKRFAGAAEQSDDITLLTVQYLDLPEAMTAREIQITIKNSFEEMEVVAARFSQFCAENELSDLVRQSVSIAIDEMLNNIISYAYQGEKDKEIEVDFDLSGKRLVTTIKDSGVPFNPFVQLAPDIASSLAEREIGGLGIHMVRSMMDEVSYQRQINKNVVKLVKYLDE